MSKHIVSNMFKSTYYSYLSCANTAIKFTNGLGISAANTVSTFDSKSSLQSRNFMIAASSLVQPLILKSRFEVNTDLEQPVCGFLL